jgi:hypothetical protein
MLYAPPCVSRETALLNDEASASDNQPDDEEDEQPGQRILTLLIDEMPVENAA